MIFIQAFIREALIRQLDSPLLLTLKIKAEALIPISLHELPVMTIGFDKTNIIDEWTALSAKGELIETVEQPLIIKIMASAQEKLEEMLEVLGAETAKCLTQDKTLGGLLKTLRLEEADLSLSHEGEQPIGVLTMRWMGIYRRPASQLDRIYH